MKAFIIAAKDLKQFSRDRTGLMMTIAMPLILILVLGFCLGGLMDSGYPTVPQFPIGIVDEDGGHLVQAFRDAVASDGLKDMLAPVELTRAEAGAQVRAAKLPGAVVFPAGYTADIMAGKAAQLTVLIDPASELRGPVIRSLAQAYSDRILAVQFALAGEAAKAVAVTGSGDPSQWAPAVRAQLAAQLAQLAEQVSLKLEAMSPELSEELSNRGVHLSAMQYYAIAMTVMFLGFAGLGGLESIIEERNLQTLNRALAAPGSRLEFIMGKFLGVLFVAGSQFAVLLLGTHFVYRVDWGTNLPGIILLALAYSFLVSGLATLVSAFNRNPKGAVGMWVLIVQLSAALGGCMVPLSAFPDSLRRISALLPNYWTLSGFFNLATGEQLATVLPSIGMLFALGAAFLGIGAWRLARE
ncbi:MAG: ABC transporter permease [Chloroflexota bacterium]